MKLFANIICIYFLWPYFRGMNTNPQSETMRGNKSRVKRQVICETDWKTIEPHTFQGNRCTLIKESFRNGESEMKLRDASGEVFFSPSVFWRELFANSIV